MLFVKTKPFLKIMNHGNYETENVQNHRDKKKKN